MWLIDMSGRLFGLHMELDMNSQVSKRTEIGVPELHLRDKYLN